MRKLLPLASLVVAGFLSSCGGGAGDDIRSALFGEGARLRPMQTQNCNFTVSSVSELQQALTQAQNNKQDDVICIRAGTYPVDNTLTYETPDGDGGKKLTIKAVGGEVVLDGKGSVQIMKIDTDSDNNANTRDAGADVTVEGITFQNGNNSVTNGEGGGLFVKTREANIILKDNTFRGNRAQIRGGGVRATSTSGNITLTNNTFENNTARFGGGVNARSESGTVTLEDNTFRGNTAQSNDSRSDGGGADASSDSGNVILRENAFIGNEARRRGGGANASSGSGTVILVNNVFSGNKVQSNNTQIQSDGGGVNASSSSGTVNLVNNTFYNNTSQHRGGGATVYLTRDEARANIYNNIFWQNTAHAGGDDGDDLFINSDGNGNGTASTVYLYNNNFSGNTHFHITLVQQGRYYHGDNIQGDPHFVNVSKGDFRLKRGSPCIDRGTNNLPQPLTLPSEDIDGEPRIVDGNGDGNAIVDIGAYEFQPTYTLTVERRGTGSGTVTSNPAGINCGQTCSARFDTGSQVTLTASPDPGSVFAGWGGDCATCGKNTQCTVTIDDHKTCTATFDRVATYTVTVNSDGNGSGSISSEPAGISYSYPDRNTGSASFSHGSTVVITAKANSGSTVSWNGTCTSAGGTEDVVSPTEIKCTFNNLDSNKTITATFTRVSVNYTLTVSKQGTGSGTVTSTPAGIDCGQTCSASFPANTQVTLEARHDPGSVFAGWGGDCASCGNNAQCTITMTKNMTCTATFNASNQTPPPTTYTLTVRKEGNGSGTVTSNPAGINCGQTCSASFNANTDVTLTASPASDSVFAGWSGDCENCGKNTQCTITMTKNMTCIATFNSNTRTVISPGGQITVTITGGSFIGDLRVDTDLGNLPVNGTTPYGGISFTAELSGGQDRITVTVTFPDIPQGALFYKLVMGRTPENITNLVQRIGNNTITFTIEDNGRFDADPQPGRIYDPIVLVVPQQQQGGGGTGTGGGGTGGTCGGGCSMGAGASPVNGLLWLLVPALVLARRIRKNL